VLDALVVHRLPNPAQQLRILIAQARISLQVNSEGHARSADGPDVQMMDALHPWHCLQIGQNGGWINPMGNFIHQLGEAIAQQHDPQPSHAQADSKTCEGINPSPACDPGDDSAQQHRG
tara:strand:- start:43 stop:399 length:357 start_codon:yes stop_codon:yes gene_type:complete